jgi:hypothetical protein
MDKAIEHLQAKVRELKEERPLKQLQDAVERRPVSKATGHTTVRSSQGAESTSRLTTDQDDAAEALAELVNKEMK